MSDLVGQALGQYELLDLVGKGGMATVYRARQQSIGRVVAVKVLPAAFMHEETFLKRFQREVQAIALMQHPRVLPVHDYGEDRGIPYIVMAYIDGGSLAQRIKEEGPLPLPDVVRLIEQIAEGLDYAHEQGVIHRDFKPSNVLLDSRGNPYLADFGIAKVSQETAQLTGSGIVGTPFYMAPEMFSGDAPSTSVDIYALGVTLYQMLSGELPYKGDTPVQLMYAHLNQPVPDICAVRADAPRAVQQVLERAMAKDPADRYQSAGDLAAALRQAAEELGMVEEAPTVEAGSAADVTFEARPTPPEISQPAPPPPAPSIPSPPISVAEAEPKPAPAWRRNWRMIVAVGTAVLLYSVAIRLILFVISQ